MKLLTWNGLWREKKKTTSVELFWAQYYIRKRNILPGSSQTHLQWCLMGAVWRVSDGWVWIKHADMLHAFNHIHHSTGSSLLQQNEMEVIISVPDGWRRILLIEPHRCGSDCSLHTLLFLLRVMQECSRVHRCAHLLAISRWDYLMSKWS